MLYSYFAKKSSKIENLAPKEFNYYNYIKKGFVRTLISKQ